MKVIHAKKPFENWTLEIKCTGGNWRQDKKVPCGSLLEINANDLIKRAWFKYPDDGGTDYGFICPICGCFSEINKNLLTEHLKNMAKDYDEVNNNNN